MADSTEYIGAFSYANPDPLKQILMHISTCGDRTNTIS